METSRTNNCATKGYILLCPWSLDLLDVSGVHNDAILVGIDRGTRHKLDVVDGYWDIALASALCSGFSGVRTKGFHPHLQCFNRVAIPDRVVDDDTSPSVICKCFGNIGAHKRGV